MKKHNLVKYAIAVVLLFLMTTFTPVEAAYEEY